MKGFLFFIVCLFCTEGIEGVKKGVIQKVLSEVMYENKEYEYQI